MSQKYPEGTIIEHAEYGEGKILGCVGDVRFISCIGSSNFDHYGQALTVADLDKCGWTVEQAPWKPDMGQKYAAIQANGTVGELIWRGDSVDLSQQALGNCYEPDSQALNDARARVLKAYKG